jgi:YbbR domain-containing protein
MPVNIDPLKEEQDFITALNVPSSISILEGVENISGKIILGTKSKNIRFDNIPVFPIKSSFEVRSNPKAINVLLTGPEELIDKISKEDLAAYIDLSQYQPGIYSIKDFDLSLPPEINIKTAWPPVDIWILENKK